MPGHFISGRCHCGSVEISVTEKPEYLNDCNCTFCAAGGAIWGYFPQDQVAVKGETSGYRRADYANQAVEQRFCKNCGNMTHWLLLLDDGSNRMGVNMRLFSAPDLEGIELRFPDGRNWTGKTDYVYRAKATTLPVHNDIGIWH